MDDDDDNEQVLSTLPHHKDEDDEGVDGNDVDDSRAAELVKSCNPGLENME